MSRPARKLFTRQIIHRLNLCNKKQRSVYRLFVYFFDMLRPRVFALSMVDRCYRSLNIIWYVSTVLGFKRGLIELDLRLVCCSCIRLRLKILRVRVLQLLFRRRGNPTITWNRLRTFGDTF